MKADKYYTPDWLAALLVAHMPDDLNGTVLDPCVGEGALLDAVVARYGTSLQILAADIDGGAAKSLKRTRPSWSVSKADVFSNRSVLNATVWRSARTSGIEVAVINPPFSYRGGGGQFIEMDDYSGIVSPAAAVIARILTYCPPSRGLYAVLPSGIMTNSRHQSFWQRVQNCWDVHIEGSVSSSAFKNARVRTVLVSITPRQPGSLGPAGEVPQIAVLALSGVCKCVEVIRGRVPLHREFEPYTRGVSYVHTTDLIEGGLRGPLRSAPIALSTQGELLLIRRVGRPVPFVLGRNHGDPVVLSDCLLAVRVQDRSLRESVAFYLESNAGNIVRLYDGTGAPHLTTTTLVNFLNDIGLNARHRSANSEPKLCKCVITRSSAA